MMKLTKLILLSACLGSSSVLANPYTVSGTLAFPEQGTIYIQLSTRDQFENGSDAGHGIVLDATDSPAAYVFENVEPGDYVIRGFQDTNENGELDMGLFGPKEPWIFVGYKPSAFKRPSFDEQKITINDHVKMDIALNP